MTQSDNSNRYNKKNTTTLCVRLNKTHDQDIIQRLQEQQSKQGYIKYPIRKDIKESK